jgi:hypothetical protein
MVLVSGFDEIAGLSSGVRMTGESATSRHFVLGCATERLIRGVVGRVGVCGLALTDVCGLRHFPMRTTGILAAMGETLNGQSLVRGWTRRFWFGRFRGWILFLPYKAPEGIGGINKQLADYHVLLGNRPPKITCISHPLFVIHTLINLGADFGF